MKSFAAELFQELDADAQRERDVTVKAFADLYRANHRAFPSEAGENSYRDIMARAYPMHPELFRLFAEVWAAGVNERFQQTRGALRLMANVVAALWHAEDAAPLILPGSIPLSEPRVRAAVLEPLDTHYAAVLDAEVEGDGARPRTIEAQRRGFGLNRAMTRAARAVFMATAPLTGASPAGVTGPRLRLLCAQPGDPINVFGDAARELAESSAYLHRDGEGYWFSTAPTLNRIASEVARDQDSADVDTRLGELLRGETGGSKFARVHLTAGIDPGLVDDARALGLVILDSRYPHSGRTAADTAAMRIAADILERRGSAQRQYRNALLFVAADEDRLDDARWSVRRLMAWSSILSKADNELQLPSRQQSEARSRQEEAFNAARRAIRAAWSHLLVPAWPDEQQAAPSRGYELHAAPIHNSGGETSVANAAFERAVRDGSVAEKLGAPNLAMLLDRVIGDQPHVALRDLAEWSARYMHMKRLHTEAVLTRAVEELIGSAGANYAWADRFDSGTGEYGGLRFGRVMLPDMRGAGVLVRRDVAAGQRSAEGGFAEPPPSLLQPKRRFVGTVAVDATRPAPHVARIARFILAELARAADTRITVTLDIATLRAEGFSDDAISAVTANARTLKFTQSGFD